MDNFLTVAVQVCVLFALMGAGAVCRWTKLVDEKSVKGMVNVLLLIVTPCVVIDVFQRPFDRTMLGSFGIGLVFAITMHFLMMLLCAAFIRHRSEGTLSVLKVATVFSNAGFIGIPLEQAILGDEGVFFGIVYIVAFNLLMWSWGIAKMGGKVSLRMMIVNPGTAGIAFGMPLFLFSAELPEVLCRPVSMLADLNTPLAMIVTGFYLAGAKLGSVIRTPAAYFSAVFRLLVCPFVMVAALWPFSGMLDREMMISLVIPASAPAGAMVTMFAAKYGRDVDMAVAIVCGTTLASIITMPMVIALAMEILS